MPTKIEWCRNPDGSAGETVNPIRFRNKEAGNVGHYCERIAAGCKNCYASRMQKPYLSGLEFTAENRDKGELLFDVQQLERVLRRRKPTTWFWADMTDLFGSWVPDEWIDRCASVVALTPQHRHIWLTKRGARMREWVSLQNRQSISRWMGIAATYRGWPLSNLILGVSASTQADADEQCDHLVRTPAACRMASFEPLIEAIDAHLTAPCDRQCDEFNHAECPGTNGPCVMQKPRLDWVIVGGESGPGARPCDVAWIRSLLRQCREAAVPCFVKQLGARITYSGATADPPWRLQVEGVEWPWESHGWPMSIGWWSDPRDNTGGPILCHRKGSNMAEWPKDLRVRQLPEVLRDGEVPEAVRLRVKFRQLVDSASIRSLKRQLPEVLR